MAWGQLALPRHPLLVMGNLSGSWYSGRQFILNDKKSISTAIYIMYLSVGRAGESIWVNFCLTTNVHAILSVGAEEMYRARNLDAWVHRPLCQRLAM